MTAPLPIPTHRNDYGDLAAANPGRAPGSLAPSRTATAASAHNMLVAILIMAAFVYLMVLLAGTSRGAGRVSVALFTGLVLVQGITHVDPFTSWVARHPLTPPTS